MHWVKLLFWGWLAFGAVTVIVGLLWTSALAKESLQETAKTTSHANRPVGFAAAEYSKVRST
jgi:hypothetical protein